ncbi:hypothetical protein [Lysobacter sp. OAE881]|uniref:hypothetical protein n=1 Tax=Lysobacter sp. OAE881 TaxID=2663813 RepID=UPI0017894574
MAAELVHSRDELIMPAHTLLGMSFELALKAFLLSRGMTVEELRKFPYGHDLEELWKAAKQRRVDRLFALGMLADDVLRTLNLHYKTHEFRYIRTGIKTVPHWEFAAPLAKSLIESLHYHCLCRRIGRTSARRRIALRGIFGRKPLSSNAVSEADSAG